MLGFLSGIFKLILLMARSEKTIICENLILHKEIQILKRKRQEKKVITNYLDRLFLVIANSVVDLKARISIVQPETLLRWQRDIIKRFWTFHITHPGKGRKPVADHIKELILAMKNDNMTWGVKRIQGELMKLAISLDVKTIWNILNRFRRQGRIKKSLAWKKFLKMQAASIYAVDLFTVDTIFNQRFYVYFTISHGTRQIIQFAVTLNPATQFVRQQIMLFESCLETAAYMIHDRTPQFLFSFKGFSIKPVCTSINSPDMNSIAERFIGTVRGEALDRFLIINEKQISNILTEYVRFYNSKRPHQGLGQQIPIHQDQQHKGNICKLPILSGLHHHYYRMAA